MSERKKIERTKAGDAVSDMFLTTFRLNGAFLGAGDRISAPFGLTAARWQILGSIMSADKTVSQVAREMGLTRQSVQRISNVLVDEGQVEFIDNPAHRRAKLLSPTKAGREAMYGLREVQYNWANDTSDGFNAEELARCVDLMRQVADRLDSMS